jgi:hypothetical protein
MTAPPVYHSDLVAVFNAFAQRHGRDLAISALYRSVFVTRIEDVAPQDRASVIAWLGRIASGEIKVPAELPFEAVHRKPYVRPPQQPVEFQPVMTMGKSRS